MVLMPVKFMNYIVPTTATRKFEYWCGNLEPFAQLAKPYGLVVEVKIKRINRLVCVCVFFCGGKNYYN